MNKKLLIIVMLVSCAGIACAQSAADSVKAAVNQLFTAMKNADAALIRTSFADSALLQSVSEKDGRVSIINEAIAGFANQIGQLGKGDADEQIQFDVVKIDGQLAIAWTPYKFYYKGKFSHCGIDSFQLVRINGVWKIQYLIDTRRKDKCD